MIRAMKKEVISLQDEIMAAGLAASEEMDLARIALLLGALDFPDRPVAPYQAHLDELTAAAWGALGKAIDAPAEIMAGVLASLISGRYQYRGDTENYDDVDNANLMQVIDRRRGLPVSLGILYLHVGKALGLDMGGLSFPGHFLLRLQAGDKAVIIDPFHGGDILGTPDLLALRRQMDGPQARLTPDFYAMVSSHDILLRLQNNILARALRAEKYDRARDIIIRMSWLDPKNPALQFELGRLEIHAGHMAAAAQAFSLCMEKAAAQGDMGMAGLAEQALRRLKSKLN